MATMAIEMLGNPRLRVEVGFALPPSETETFRYQTPGRFLSHTVRKRNTRIGRSWWQPSRATRSPSRPRATVLQEILQDEIDDDDAEASFESPPPFLAYGDCARYYERMRLEEAEAQLQLARKSLETRRLGNEKKIRRMKRRIAKLEKSGQTDREVQIRLQLVDLEIQNAA